MKNIALYGGAFNPPTLAHRKVITGVIEAGLVQEVILAPTGPRSDKSYGIENHFREKILEIFYQELIADGYPIVFSDHFLKNKNNGETTTLSMDRYFQSIGYQNIAHIFGVDVIPHIANWVENENQEVENRLRKIFVKRQGYIIPQPFTMQHTTFIDLDIEGISSTLAKEIIRTKQNVNGILTKKVAEFIQANNLYV